MALRLSTNRPRQTVHKPQIKENQINQLPITQKHDQNAGHNPSESAKTKYLDINV